MSGSISIELLEALAKASPDKKAAVLRYLRGAEGELGRAQPLYGLRRELGTYSMVINGRLGILPDNRAVRLAVYLLTHPPDEAIHASDWESRVDGRPLLAGAGGIGRAEEDDRPAIEVGDLGGVIQEQTGRKFMGGITLPALKERLAELRAAMEDLTLPEAERDEARQQFVDLLRAHGRGGKLANEPGRAVDRVRKQIWTLIQQLLAAERAPGEPHKALREFGRHLEAHLWRPSLGGRKRLGAAGKPGCFTYEPPDGVRWVDSTFPTDLS